MFCIARRLVQPHTRQFVRHVSLLNSRSAPFVIPSSTLKTFAPGVRVFSTTRQHYQLPTHSSPQSPPPLTPEPKDNKPALRENIYTIPNALTASRILSCPVLGWAILEGRYGLASGILLYAGVTDWVSFFLVL